MEPDANDDDQPVGLDRRALTTMLIAAGAGLTLGGAPFDARAGEIPLESNGQPVLPIAACFIQWWDNEHDRLRQRIVIKSQSWLDFGFDVGGSALRAHLSEHNLNVAVDDGDVWWDLLLDLDVHPQRSRGGWTCGDCAPEARRVFATHEDLWRDHLFEPLLAWINEELAPAHTLALFGSEEGGSRARLVGSAEAAIGATKVVALKDAP